MVGTLADNVWFSSDFDRAESVEGVQGWQLVPEESHGREVQPNRE